jgi:hypothetical protein
MLDFIGMVVTAALMMLVVNALITFMDTSRGVKTTLAAVIGVWIGVASENPVQLTRDHRRIRT